MLNYYTIVVFLIFVFLGACNSTKILENSSPVFVNGRSSRELDKKTKQRVLDHERLANLSSIESLSLANGDVELRIWIEGGQRTWRVLIFSKRSGVWDVIHVGIDDFSGAPRTQALTAKSTNWDEVFSQLTRSGILESPEDSELTRQTLFYDGQSVILQFLTASERVEYSVIEPCAQEIVAAKNVCTAVKSLSKIMDLPLLALPLGED